MVALYDIRNRAYTEDWVNIFTKSFAGQGRSVETVPFDAGKEVSFLDVVNSIKEIDASTFYAL